MYPASRPSLPLSGSCVGENCSTNEEPSREGWRVEVISQDREIVPWAARHQATTLTRLDTATSYTGWHIFCSPYRVTRILLLLQDDTLFFSYYRVTHIIYLIGLYTGWRIIPPACTGVMVLSGCDQATGLWRRCHWYQARDLSVCPDRIQDT